MMLWRHMKTSVLQTWKKTSHHMETLCLQTPVISDYHTFELMMKNVIEVHFQLDSKFPIGEDRNKS